MPQSLIHGLAHRVERAAGLGGTEPEAARHGLVGRSVCQAVKGGGESVIGRDGRNRGGEKREEEGEEESEGGFGDVEEVGPVGVVVGGGGEEAVEPALLERLGRERPGGGRRGEGGDGEERGREKGLQG
jgi:hypothetical protein